MLALTGCDGSGAPDPAPAVPTPSYHASPSDTAATDADVADATAALTAYWNAGDDLDWADASSFESFYALSTGEQNREDRQLYGELLAAGWRVDGTSQLRILGIAEPPETSGEVRLSVCVDISGLRFFDSSGVEQVRRNSVNAPARTVVLTRLDQAARWLVSDIVPRETGEPC